MRVRSFNPAMPIVVISFLAYGWADNQKSHVAGLVITLFLGGASLMCVCDAFEAKRGSTVRIRV